MTERTPHLDDELASAALDGEATPGEAARVAADPALQARLAAFAAVRDAVATPVTPVADAARDAAIARAIAGVEVTSMSEARAKRATPDRAARWLRPVTVAAAVLLLLAAVPLLARLGRSDGGEQAATHNADTTVAPLAGAGTAGASGAGGAPAADASAQSVGLGSFDSPAELRAAVTALETRDSASYRASAPAAGSAAPDPYATEAADLSCDAALRAAFPNLGDLQLLATAVLAGEPVDVFVYSIADPGDGPARQLLAVTPSSCAIRNAQAF